MPPCDVIEAFNMISKSAPVNLLPMLTYLEKWYIGNPDKVTNKQTIFGLRKIPCYPIQIWNCYNRVLNHDTNTNNSSEAWNLLITFELDIGKHLTIKLIEQFRIEQKIKKYCKWRCLSAQKT